MWTQLCLSDLGDDNTLPDLEPVSGEEENARANGL